MQPFLRPVGIGLIIGLMSLLFGVFWAVYITVNHESIHRTLSESAAAVIKDKFVINSAPEAGHAESRGHGAHEHSSHDHGASPSANDHDGHSAVAGSRGEASMAPVAQAHHGHDDPLMALAHERLTRGHLHAMGLGLLTICVSLMLALIRAPAKMKTLASAAAAIGGFFYPFAWIIMGFRTTALGAEASAESVFPIAAFSVALVAAGLLLTLYYFIAGALHRD